MTMELHPAIDGESKSPRTGGGFEASKESKKRRQKEQRAHERAHAALEPLTIWVRTEPNRLQYPDEPTKKVAEKPNATVRVKSAPKVEISPKMPSPKLEANTREVNVEPTSVAHEQEIIKQVAAEEAATIPEPEMPKSTPPKSEAVTPFTQEMPEFQDLPRLDIRPRHFYTEPELRQPGTTEVEHDILPSITPKEESKSAEIPAAPKLDNEMTTKSLSPAEQLQELAEQKARRAEELERKNLDEPVLPEIQPEKPKAELNEHVRAMSELKLESDISMKLNELLIVAESIHVDGVSISEMFHAERIDEEGLRRIISDFLRGNRIEQVVADEILRQQLRFERDPQLRQIPLTTMRDDANELAQVDRSQQRKVFNKQTVRRQADRIADRLADGIDRTVEAAENNPNMFKTFGTIVAVIAYFIVLILIIRS